MEILYSKILNENGTGIPLIILHGIFGMSDNWYTLGKRFAEKRPVHLLDLRNHGKSFWSDEMSLPLMAQDLANYMHAHNLPQADLIGHSLGGKVVLQFLAQDSQKAHKAVIVDITPEAYPPHHQNIFKALEEIDFNIDKSRNAIDKKLSTYIPEIAVRQFLMKNITKNNKNDYQLGLNLRVIKNNYISLLDKIDLTSNISTPVLFIKGQHSNYITSQNFLLIEPYFSNVRLIEIKDSGHWVHAENPDDFFNEVEKFLE